MTTRRLKTYTAQTGYVYAYYFVGQRRALAGEPPSVEYIFDVSPDRKTTFAVSVFVLDAAVAGWGQAHGRALNEAEQYAAAKMRLLQTFDEIEDVMGRGRRLSVDLEALEQLLSSLGVD
jgi:dsRNA-specific ribonuclease